MTEIKLKKGKEKAVLQHHPWIFSGAIEQINGKVDNGEVVKVCSFNNDFLCYGYFNNQSRIVVRVIEWNKNAVIDAQWYEHKIEKALALRQHLLADGHTNTCRLIFSEADFMPGLIVDRYADYLSLQISSSGIEKAKAIIVNLLVKILKPKAIFDKSDATALNHEGLVAGKELLWGKIPDDFIVVKENGIQYYVNIVEGQKSGFYCDQRDNRKALASYVKDKSVLDCFSYSGGFSLNAMAQGAKEVTSVDSSALAIETLKQNIALNGFDIQKHLAIQNDVNKQLRQLFDEGKRYDVVVLDPPKYAPSRSALDRAARAYKDLNRRGMMLLESGGLLATFSCSGAMDINTFKDIIAWAALDAGKNIQIIHQFCQPEDHPIRLSFPEGEYLKGLLLRVV